VFGGYENNIVLTFAGNLDSRDKQWLRVNRSVHFERTQLTELPSIDVLWLKSFLIQSSAGAQVVVLRSGDLREAGSRGECPRDKSTTAYERLHETLRYCFSA
jgi:hypothetical protein